MGGFVLPHSPIYLRLMLLLMYFSIIAQILSCCPFVVKALSHPRLLVTTDLFVLPMVLTFLEGQVNGIMYSFINPASFR